LTSSIAEITTEGQNTSITRGTAADMIGLIKRTMVRICDDDLDMWQGRDDASSVAQFKTTSHRIAAKGNV
jgi:hypothetical protein